MRSNAKASSAGSSMRRASGLGRIVRGAFATRGASSDAGGSGAPSFRFAIALCTVAGALGLFVAPASAELPTHPALPTLNQSGFTKVCGIAVDSAGNRYVADYGATAATSQIKIYSPSGTLITSFTPEANAQSPCRLAVDSQGNVYVNGRAKDVVRYKPSAFPPSASPATTYEPDTSLNGSGVLVSFGANGVAVNPANDDVYVASGGSISAYKPNGELISETIGNASTIGGAEFPTYSSVAVRGDTGKIYAYDFSNNKAYVLNPDGTKLLAETDGSSTQAGSFEEAATLGIAVDQSNGHFYIVDAGGAEGHNAVDEFDAGGELVSEIATPALEGGRPSAVAVDNSGGANDGDVFFAIGKEPASVLAYGPLTPPTHPALPTLNQSGFTKVCGIAVDSAGNRYVADYGATAATSQIKIYSPSGTLITSFTPEANAQSPCRLAVDSQGNVYVNGRAKDVVRYKPSAFPPSASPATTYEPDTSLNGSGVLVSFGANGVAVNPANDDVYVASGGSISAYKPNGELISETIGNASTIGGAEFPTYSSVAVRGDTGKIYAYDFSNNKAYVLNPDGTKLLAETDGSSTQAGSFEEAATLGIAVDQSNGHFYIVDAGGAEGHNAVDEFDAGGELVSEIATPALEGGRPSAVAVDNSGGANDGDVFFAIGKEPASVLAYGPLTYIKFFDLEVARTGAGKGTVTSAPAGINCGGTCKFAFEEETEVTLTATADPGSKFASWQGCDSVAGNECTVAMSAKRKVTAKFNTKPAIESVNVHPLDTSATLEAEINPNGEETTYQFEFLTEEAYQANGESFSGPEEPLLLPEPPESIGNGDVTVAVSAEAPDLTPHTAYRFRVVASNMVDGVEAEPLAFITYSPPNVFEPCANDALRDGQPSAALPDCRAYEQASPVEKNGGDITGTPHAVRASVEGNRVNFWVSSPIPGAEGAQSFTPPYLATRGPDGWSTQGLLPPQREGQEALAGAWTPDMSQTFGYVTKIGAPRKTKVYARSSLDHSITTIFPLTTALERPPIAGSSADGSIVFFENFKEPLLDGAAEGAVVQNLYVGDRDTGTVRLAGVLNDEEAPSAGAFAGSYDWMFSDPSHGGAREKYYLQDQHAISADGSSVYFTAGHSGQLYLRKNPTEPQSDVVTSGQGEEECTQPELACTVHVSASRKDNGPGGGPDPAGAQPAAFMGASTDGSVAYLTSPEMLTNDANTGPEQPPAGIGRAKIGASEGEDPEPSFLPKHAMGVTTSPDGKYIYWVDPIAGTIGRAELHGDEPPTNQEDEFIVPGTTKFESHPYSEPGVIHDIPSHPRYVAVDSEYVYWTNAGLIGKEQEGGYIDPRPAPGAGTIGRAKLDSEGNLVPGEVKTEFITGASGPEGIAVNASHIYWANASGLADHSIGRSTLDGNIVQQSFFLAGSNETPKTLSLDANNVYYSADTTNEEFENLRYIPLEGGEPYGGNVHGSIGGIAVVGDYVYWTDTMDGTIGRREIDSPNFLASCVVDANCESEYLGAEGTLGGIASDVSHLYWAANGEGTTNPGNDLYRYEADTGELTDLTPDANLSDVNGADVQGILGSSEDGSYVYFVANGVLASGASLGDCQGTPARGAAGECNLYLEHQGQITFIARLAGNLGGSGAISDVADWSGRSRSEGGDHTKQSWVSADGQTLLFWSVQKLTDYENTAANGDRRGEYYRYTVGDADPICVTCNPTGLQVTDGPSLGRVEAPIGVTSFQPVPVQNRNLSADGNRFFFATTEALVASDTNGNEGCPQAATGARVCQDVYEWEAKGSGSCESEAQNGGCLYLISSGKSTDASYFLDASASGDDVFFYTRSKLAAQDKDDLIDVYDARVGGGFASQNEPPPPPPCEGEACKDGPKAPPEVGSPSTPLFSGPGNPKPKHKKAKARKHKHKSHKHKRHAKKNGRAHR